MCRSEMEARVAALRKARLMRELSSWSYQGNTAHHGVFDDAFAPIGKEQAGMADRTGIGHGNPRLGEARHEGLAPDEFPQIKQAL